MKGQQRKKKKWFVLDYCTVYTTVFQESATFAVELTILCELNYHILSIHF